MGGGRWVQYAGWKRKGIKMLRHLPVQEREVLTHKQSPAGEEVRKLHPCGGARWQNGRREMAPCPTCETIPLTPSLGLILKPPIPLLYNLQIYWNALTITLFLLNTWTCSRLLWLFLHFTRAGFYSSLFIAPPQPPPPLCTSSSSFLSVLSLQFNK